MNGTRRQEETGDAESGAWSKTRGVKADQDDLSRRGPGKVLSQTPKVGNGKRVAITRSAQPPAWSQRQRSDAREEISEGMPSRGPASAMSLEMEVGRKPNAPGPERWGWTACGVRLQ